MFNFIKKLFGFDQAKEETTARPEQAPYKVEPPKATQQDFLKDSLNGVEAVEIRNAIDTSFSETVPTPEPVAEAPKPAAMTATKKPRRRNPQGEKPKAKPMAKSASEAKSAPKQPARRGRKPKAS